MPPYTDPYIAYAHMKIIQRLLYTGSHMYVLTKVIANRNDLANHISWTASICVQELVTYSERGNIMFHPSKCVFFLTHKCKFSALT